MVFCKLDLNTVTSHLTSLIGSWKLRLLSETLYTEMNCIIC